MTKLPFLTFLLTSFVTVTLAQNSPAEKFVKAFSERKNTWLINKNYDSISSMLDARCLYLHSNGWVQTAKEVVDDLKSGKAVYKKISVTESTARQFEKMVIVTGKGQFEGSGNGKDFSLKLMFTEVYVNRSSGWKLVSRQAGKLE